MLQNIALKKKIALGFGMVLLLMVVMSILAFWGVTGMDDETFSDRLLHEKHVAAVPGSAFGPGGEGFIRCSYATAYDKLEEALDRVHQFVKSL